MRLWFPAPFRQVVFEAGEVQGHQRVGTKVDILIVAEEHAALSQYAVLLSTKWSGSSFPCTVRRLLFWGRAVRPLDVVHECARAGVSETTLLGRERTHAQQSCLPSWAFGKERTQIIDTEQKRSTFLQLVPGDKRPFLFELLRQLQIAAADLVFAPKILVGLVLPSSLVIS